MAPSSGRARGRCQTLWEQPAARGPAEHRRPGAGLLVTGAPDEKAPRRAVRAEARGDTDPALPPGRISAQPQARASWLPPVRTRGLAGCSPAAPKRNTAGMPAAPGVVAYLPAPAGDAPNYREAARAAAGVGDCETRGRAGPARGGVGGCSHPRPASPAPPTAVLGLQLHLPNATILPAQEPALRLPSGLSPSPTVPQREQRPGPRGVGGLCEAGSPGPSARFRRSKGLTRWPLRPPRPLMF